ARSTRSRGLNARVEQHRAQSQREHAERRPPGAGVARSEKVLATQKVNAKRILILLRVHSCPSWLMQLPRTNGSGVLTLIRPARGLEKEPGAPLGFINPNFDQARCGDVSMFFANVVRLAQARGQLLVVPGEFCEHVQW